MSSTIYYGTVCGFVQWWWWWFTEHSIQRTCQGLVGRRVIGGGIGAGLYWSWGELESSSAPSTCGIPPGESATLRFLLDLVSRTAGVPGAVAGMAATAAAVRGGSVDASR